MNLISYISNQIEWSRMTFGGGKRTIGITEHIKKEIEEVKEDTDRFEEWIDIVILALDGAWRAGATAGQIVGRLEEKQAINIRRVWPPIPAQHEVSEHIK